MAHLKLVSLALLVFGIIGPLIPLSVLFAYGAIDNFNSFVKVSTSIIPYQMAYFFGGLAALASALIFCLINISLRAYFILTQHAKTRSPLFMSGAIGFSSGAVLALPFIGENFIGAALFLGVPSLICGLICGKLKPHWLKGYLWPEDYFIEEIE